MLSWSLVFFALALIAGVLGFAGLAGSAAGVAKLLLGIFALLFVASVLLGRRARPLGR